VGSTALAAASLWTTYGDLCSLLDDRGENFENAPNLLIVPPKKAETAYQLLSDGVSIVAAATAYINTVPKLGLDLEVSPYWANTVAGSQTTCWGLAKTDGIVKPLILQLFAPAANGQLFEFSALEGTSDNGFMRDTFYYGIRGRWELGYGDWRSFYLHLVA
jgi:phage major head subunit gpT-like protein